MLSTTKKVVLLRPRAGGAVFSPADIEVSASGVLWLKADTAVFQDSGMGTPSGDGDVVGGWGDQFASGNDVIQATTAKKPLLRLAAINNLPALEFDGTDDLLANIVSDLDLSGTDKPLAIFVVMKLTSIASDGTMLSVGDSGGTIIFYHFTSDNAPAYNVGRRDDGSVTKTHVDGTPQTANYVIAASLMNGIQSTIRIDGADVGTPDTDLDVGVSTFDQFAVGAFKRSTESKRFPGFIAEVIVYGADLSAGDVANVESYLSDRYGIALP